MKSDPMSSSPADSELFLGPDEFAYKVYKLEFGGLDNSIPDRIRRAAALMRVLLEDDRMLNANDRILILGAGATGIAAACAARELRMVPVVIDYRARFALQAGCTTRFIHPNQYSWPNQGFDVLNWDRVDLACLPGEPFRPTGPPQKPLLPWKAARAHEIAAEWESWFDNFNRYGNMIEVRIDRSLRHVKREDARDEITEWINRSGSSDYSAIIIAKSHRHEKVTLNAYQGFAFWESDPFEEPDYGLGPGNTPQIVISGAGNGGLQDYIRIVTRKQPFEVLGELRKAYDYDTNPEFEDDFKNAFDPGSEYADLKGVIEPVVNYMLGDRWRRYLLDKLVEFPFNKSGTLTLIHRKWVFGLDSYALNVWLVLLLSTYLEKHFDLQTLLPGVSGARGKETTVTVDSQNSGFAGPRLYHGRNNIVHVTVEKRDPASKNVVGESTRDLTANILVVRHGIYPFLTRG